MWFGFSAISATAAAHTEGLTQILLTAVHVGLGLAAIAATFMETET
jgi:hypothetical protein